MTKQGQKLDVIDADLKLKAQSRVEAAVGTAVRSIVKPLRRSGELSMYESCYID